MKPVFKTTGKKDPVKEFAVSFSAGDRIFSQGDLGAEMYIVLEGEVHLVKTIRGEPLVLSKLEKGDFFGEMAVIESAARTSDAVAHADTRLLAINAARFDDMLRKNPEIALRMIRKYAIRLQEANALLEQLAGREVDPDIDLTPVDVDRSVSRRHAKILRRDGNYMILEEVGTINGTYVNDQRIPTGQPVPLNNGDRLRVGLINMKVVFE